MKPGETLQTWGYAIVQSQGGQVQSPQGGTLSIAQVLNMFGQKGGELVTVVPANAGLLEWIFKFPTQAPESLF